MVGNTVTEEAGHLVQWRAGVEQLHRDGFAKVTLAIGERLV